MANNLDPEGRFETAITEMAMGVHVVVYGITVLGFKLAANGVTSAVPSGLWDW